MGGKQMKTETEIINRISQLKEKQKSITHSEWWAEHIASMEKEIKGLEWCLE